jgi:predicted amidohydrolase
MKIASVQLEMMDGRSKEQTIDYALDMMDKCKGADLVLLPELWNIGFSAYDKYWSESEPIDGPTARAVSKKAKELGAYVFSGSFVEKRGDKYHNTSILFDRKGDKIGQYSKIHLFTYKSREPELLTPGTDIAVVNTEFGKMGLSICYDLRFPELYREMTGLGAKFFLVSSGWPYPRLEPWNILNQARAIENTCCLISSNAAGVQNGVRLLGHSQVVDPWGNVIAGSGYLGTIVKAEIDDDLVDRTRAEFPVLEDRVLGVSRQSGRV